jgi:L,D-peptidoglycan transpeptidase YkuD (ErfK/YbiS/YcfS/YnhG family)
MAAWRSAQKGHATLPSSMPVSWSVAGGRSRGRRLAWSGAALALMVLGSLLWVSSQTQTLRGWLERAPGSASTGVAVSLPTLIESAIARTDPAAQQASVIDSAGLLPISLSDDRFESVVPLLGTAEARLIEIYQHIGRSEHRQALALTEQLVRDHPNFQLAQLVLGDLLSLQTRPVRRLGDVPDTKAEAAAEQLEALREESRRRIRALTERPPEGSIPTQFLALAPQSRHAIAVDASRSRLYLFENLATGGQDEAPRLRLLGDFYISVGLSGIEKEVEGDKRTPLGVYYITSNLDPRSLPDLYGVGALPINYPNPLDLQRGKTGSGIWLHGTPREQFVRAPLASDGCVVLSNPDLERLLGTVQIRTTPVVIAPDLRWVDPDTITEERSRFEATLDAWRQARSAADAGRLRAFYSPRFRAQGRDLQSWWPRAEGELHARGAREIELKDLSILHWQDSENTMVVTFGEVPQGSSRGVTRRQYWILENDRWQIFFEGNA